MTISLKTSMHFLFSLEIKKKIIGPLKFLYISTNLTIIFQAIVNIYHKHGYGKDNQK